MTDATKRRLQQQHAEVYELERGGYLCKTKAGKWIVVDANGEEVKL
jgi:hypothetical protein